MSKEQTEYKPVENGFINIVQRRDELEIELDEEIKRIVGHVRRVGGKAKLTLTLNFNKLQFEGGVGIGHDLKVTLPKEKKNDTLMWADRENGLIHQDQEQEDLFEQKKTELKPAATTVSPLRPSAQQ